MPAHGLEVDQVGAHKGVVRAPIQPDQAARVRGVGQCVEIDKEMLGVARNQQVQEIRADESGPSGDEYFHVVSGRNHTPFLASFPSEELPRPPTSRRV